MSLIKVNWESLAAMKADVDATAGDMRTSLEELRRFLAPLVATWSGGAAEDYQVRQREWDTAAAGLTDVLGRIGVALGTAGDAYRATEEANRRRWGA